ncbi:uncharacterized protein SCHCODRAFT_02124593 [Schizophyllum commune H4-8]|uniref:uncharacterized protein n=1 Tax=Schizophyllum commune (strain H4-8 / FGSC 9210) TaxID=578458 RepID=UPI0021604596|nr:uncharacterized protein SCHCODRAFT_02124593 [Schizophyllum commune H4-8]KAI5885287.1 hypothetical protein SCHCODRAFT_02124593 [Schizophyllum commune H4-8]
MDTDSESEGHDEQRERLHRCLCFLYCRASTRDSFFTADSRESRLTAVRLAGSSQSRSSRCYPWTKTLVKVRRKLRKNAGRAVLASTMLQSCSNRVCGKDRGRWTDRRDRYREKGSRRRESSATRTSRRGSRAIPRTRVELLRLRSPITCAHRVRSYAVNSGEVRQERSN